MYPKDYRYSKDHEWIKVEGGVGVIGITDFAQAELGDVVYLDLPAVGRQLAKHEVFGSVESVKAVSDLFSPVAGEVVAINKDTTTAPETVNSDPHGKAWLIKVKLTNAADVDELMTADAYESFITKAGH